ncbi:MarR family winged helix-turn-helix transcriptional regulator [Plantactinospora sonchi]|uniref:MarR family transcriptional regulator n=1 Tax=Plantactinospora sonchi TaxID=1544735 RepID=A0ABU7RKS2_9ACTN
MTNRSSERRLRPTGTAAPHADGAGPGTASPDPAGPGTASPDPARPGTASPDTAGPLPGDANAGVDLLQTVTSFDRLLRLLRRLTTPDGLSLTAASTLYLLDEAGAQRISDLAVAEGVTQPGMTQLISRLERDGLAERRGDPADRRVVAVAITQAGRELVARRRQARAERLAGLLADVSPEERAAIVTSLAVLDRLAGPARNPVEYGPSVEPGSGTR